MNIQARMKALIMRDQSLRSETTITTIKESVRQRKKKEEWNRQGQERARVIWETQTRDAEMIRLRVLYAK
jgi:hypothetical protein